MKLYTLFTLGIFIIAITCIRLPINTAKKDSQISRTTWASIELLTAAIVVNAPTLYGLWNTSAQAKSMSRSHTTGGLSYGSQAIDLSTVRKPGPVVEVDSIRGPREGIMKTRGVIVTDFRESKRRSERYANLPDEEDNISSHSSHTGILKN